MSETDLERRGGIMSATYAATTVGMFALIGFVAFEAMAVATIMPTVARELDGRGLYALSFAAPLASGVVGMVAAGSWCDRGGPRVPLVASMVVFSVGLLVCGLSPTMAVLILGRLVQGLGGGALIVAVYVLVGLLYPARLQASVFASFAAAWVLPALFGPGLAAWLGGIVGWRWVFLGSVAFVALAALLVTPALRSLTPPAAPAGEAPRGLLGWAVLAAVGAMALELLGSRTGATALSAVLALVAVLYALRHLTPPATLRAGHGLPAVIATRGLLSASFFCGETYIVYALQDLWGLSPGRAGIALTCVGLVWALASQLQSRLGERVSDERAMTLGCVLVLGGLLLLTVATYAVWSPVLAAASYVITGAGMGFAYPRTGVAMLAASTEADRGFNSSALSISDSLGGALALAIAGATFEWAHRLDGDAFVAVFVLGTTLAVLALASARRTRAIT